MENTLRAEIFFPETPAKRGLPLSGPESGRRYEWKWVNFSRFLYDKVEDLYIPEAVYNAISKT